MYAEEYDDWLYSVEADVAEHAEINLKYDSMHKIVSKAKVRLSEMESRPEAIELAGKVFRTVRSKTKKIRENKKWMPEEKI